MHVIVVLDSILHIGVRVLKLILDIVIEVLHVIVLLLEILLVLVLHLFLIALIISHLTPLIITVLNHFVTHYVLRIW